MRAGVSGLRIGSMIGTGESFSSATTPRFSVVAATCPTALPPGAARSAPVCSGSEPLGPESAARDPSETNVGRMVLSRPGEDREGRNVFEELSLRDGVAWAGQMVMVTGNQWLIRFLENIDEF